MTPNEVYDDSQIQTNDNVTQFTVKHSSYINANIRLSNQMTYLHIITLPPSPIPSQIPHTLIDKILLDVDAVLCHGQDTCKTVHTCARSKMPQYNIVINV